LAEKYQAKYNDPFPSITFVNRVLVTNEKEYGAELVPNGCRTGTAAGAPGLTQAVS